MARIFLSTSFSAYVEPDGGVSAQFRSELEPLIEAVEVVGYTVACAVRDDGWMVHNVSPSAAYQRDIDAIRSSDAMVALLEYDPPSVGVQFELGYGQALGLPLVMVYREGVDLPYMNQALIQQAGVQVVTYDLLPGAAAAIIDRLKALS